MTRARAAAACALIVIAVGCGGSNSRARSTSTAGTSPAGPRSSCEAEARTATFVHINAATAGPSGALGIVGNPVTLVCGGPDDRHFAIGGSTENATVVPGATVQVLTNSGQPRPLAEVQLPSYLSTDQQPRVFAVTGPLLAVTGLQEQFQP